MSKKVCNDYETHTKRMDHITLLALQLFINRGKNGIQFLGNLKKLLDLLVLQKCTLKLRHLVPLCLKSLFLK